jgi:hypothetical protein
MNYEFVDDPTWDVTWVDDHEEYSWKYIEYQEELNALSRLLAYLRWYQDPTNHSVPTSEGV